MQKFRDIFKKREYSVIRGESGRGMIFLVLVMFLMFIALGHVFGGLEDLNKRMVNPFTNWISFYKKGVDDKLDRQFTEDFNQNKTLMSRFKVRGVSEYSRNYTHIYNEELTEYRPFIFRTIKYSKDELLLGAIAQDNNCVIKRKSMDRCAVFITETALLRMGYSINDDLEYIPFLYTDKRRTEIDQVIFLRVAAIVRELPDDADVLMSNQLFSLIEREPAFVGVNNKQIRLLSGTQTDEFGLKYKDVLLDRYNEKTESNHQQDVFLFDENVPDNVYEYISAEKIPIIKETSCFGVEENFAGFYTSINLADTEKVDSLRSYLNESYSIELPLVQVKSAENFYKMSRLANLFILLLVIFSIFSILLLFYNIITSHFNSISQDLGTLKAFGLDNRSIQSLYIGIFSKYFLRASVWATVGTCIYFFVLKIFNQNQQFKLMDYRFILIWILIAIMSLIFFRIIIQRSLFHSPGNLIYKR